MSAQRKSASYQRRRAGGLELPRRRHCERSQYRL